MPDRLNAALDELERRLTAQPGQDPDVAALARAAATSEHHLRRMFTALAGMPLGEYVRRRRATLAGAAVLAGAEPLLGIAVRFGYGSAEGFGRAFRAVHGATPGEARRTGAVLRAQQRLSFRVVVEGSAVMEYRIAEPGPFRLVGLRARVPLVHEGMNPAIVDFLRGIPPLVRDRIGTLADGEPAGALNVSDGLGADRTEGTELDYWYAAARYGGPAEDEHGLETLDVPAGAWAVLAVSGAFPAVVQELWRDVFTQWFPSNPWRSRPGPEMLRNEPRRGRRDDPGRAVGTGRAGSDGADTRRSGRPGTFARSGVPHRRTSVGAGRRGPAENELPSRTTLSKLPPARDGPRFESADGRWSGVRPSRGRPDTCTQHDARRVPDGASAPAQPVQHGPRVADEVGADRAQRDGGLGVLVDLGARGVGVVRVTGVARLAGVRAPSGTTDAATGRAAASRAARRSVTAATNRA